LSGLVEDLQSLYRFKWFKISAFIFLGGFFIGYDLAFLDFTAVLVPFPYLLPYLANSLVSAWHSDGFVLADKLEYVKYTFAEAVIVLGGGVLIGLATVGALFILGLSVGTCMPAILEYAEAIVVFRSVVFSIFFTCAMILFGTSGLSLGSSILHLIRNTSFKTDRRTYDAFLLGLSFLILSIIIQAIWN